RLKYHAGLRYCDRDMIAGPGSVYFIHNETLVLDGGANITAETPIPSEFVNNILLKNITMYATKSSSTISTNSLVMLGTSRIVTFANVSELLINTMTDLTLRPGATITNADGRITFITMQGNIENSNILAKEIFVNSLQFKQSSLLS